MAYALAGKLAARPGRRDELRDLMLESGAALDAMPGCMLYLISEARDDADALWITEVWNDEAPHRASLQLDAVRAVIERAMPIIDMDRMEQVHLVPVGGKWPGGPWPG
jgi:quinol monooxygenase YgiN